MYRWQQRQFRQIIYGLLIGFCLVIGLGVGIHPAQAQINQATVTEILDGNQVFIQGRQARISNIAGSGQQVSTGGSRAGLRFNNGSAGRLRSNTSLVIGQCIQLQQGGIVVSGPTNACIGSVRVATRGTSFVAELDANNSYNLKVLEGSIAVAPNNSTLTNSTLTNPINPTNTTNSINPTLTNSTNPILTNPTLTNPTNPTNPTLTNPTNPILTNPTNPTNSTLANPTNPTLANSTNPTNSTLANPTNSTLTNSTLTNSTLTNSTLTNSTLTSSTSLTITDRAPATTEVIIRQGEKVSIANNGQVSPATKITVEDILDILNKYFSGFSQQLPGSGNLQRALEELFPGVPLPNLRPTAVRGLF